MDGSVPCGLVHQEIRKVAMFHRPREEDPVSNKKARPDEGKGGSVGPSSRSASKNSTQQVTSSNQQKEYKTMSQHQSEEKNEHGNEQRQTDVPVGMQRMQNVTGSSPRMPGSYSSSGYAYGNTSQNSSSSTELAGSGRKLIVGEGINLSGEIEACDHLIVEGRVEATLKGANILDIAETGVFYGTVEIEEATIAGRFEGDLAVAGRLTIKSTGSITGAIAYRELAVEAGAVVDGKIGPIRNRAEAKKTEGKNSQQQPRKREQQAYSEEEGLPFEEKAVEAAE